jgi:hypothetical protein
MEDEFIFGKGDAIVTVAVFVGHLIKETYCYRSPMHIFYRKFKKIKYRKIRFEKTIPRILQQCLSCAKNFSPTFRLH